MTDPAAIIRDSAQALGFARIRFTPIERAPGIEGYDRFLAEGRQADMGWMVTGRAPRANPHQLLAEARSAVVLGIDYGWPRPADPGGLTGKVACYAWGRDYHNLVGKRLKKLWRRLSEQGIKSTWGIDSRPFIERAWAEQAGMGFTGRNCCTILPGQGSYLFLAVGLVDQELPADRPRLTMERHCGACRRCLDACPTGAFLDSGLLDARLCISWMTIENRGPIPEHLRPKMGRWVFGCDDCQEVCPHNHRPPTPLEEDFEPLPGRAWMDLEEILMTPDEVLDRSLLGSPIRRAKPWGLKRNAAVVLGNLGDRAGRKALLHALSHENEIVREHARWGLDRL